LAARFPHHWKINGVGTKVILKETFAELLPPEIIQPRKRGFSMPIARWFRGELREPLEEALHDPEIVTSGVFRMKELHALAREHRSGRRDRSDVLWRYLFFVRWWHKRFETVA